MTDPNIRLSGRTSAIATNDDKHFIPILTVMPDYGFAPFLWIVSGPGPSGVGGNILGGGDEWYESCPMSKALLEEFSPWAIEFNRTYFDYQWGYATDWDWIAYHERGLALTRKLKEEVGDAYRVVYEKPSEDPNHSIQERTEILSGGTLVSLPSHAYRDILPDGTLSLPSSNFGDEARCCRHIVSGGQTGADRAALDFAIECGRTHGGWAPQGRMAEDGRIPMKYQLTELPEGGYRQRTKRNVEDSDGTLIVNLGELDGGSLETQTFALKAGKPCLVVQLDCGVSVEMVEDILVWARKNSIRTLNIAGPRESKRPGIYDLTRWLLDVVADRSLGEDGGTWRVFNLAEQIPGIEEMG